AEHEDIDAGRTPGLRSLSSMASPNLNSLDDRTSLALPLDDMDERSEHHADVQGSGGAIVDSMIISDCGGGEEVDLDDIASGRAENINDLDNNGINNSSLAHQSRIDQHSACSISPLTAFNAKHNNSKHNLSLISSLAQPGDDDLSLELSCLLTHRGPQPEVVDLQGLRKPVDNV
ncbi:unnamed protein product, partial [Amoebophrya sp. A25]